MTKKIIITINVIGLIVTIYWILKQSDLALNPEPILTFFFALANIIGLSAEQSIDNMIKSKQKIKVNQNQGTIAGHVGTIVNNISAVQPQNRITQNLTSLQTKGNCSLLSQNGITGTPANNQIDIKVNSQTIRIGNGVKTDPCYFSSDSGITAKHLNQIVTGDKLYWNGIIAGFDIDTSDILELTYY